MTIESRRLTGLSLCLFLCACGDQPPAAWNSPSAEDAARQAGYLVSPVVRSVMSGPAGQRLLKGTAGAGNQIELVPMDSGSAVTSVVDASGNWQVGLTDTPRVRQFTVVTSRQGRTLPASDRIVQLPNGWVAVMSPGLPTRVIGRQKPALIQAVDFDRAGGAALSGAAPANQGIVARVDRRPAGETHPGTDGQYGLALAAPLSAGAHAFDVASDTGQQSVELVMSPPTAERTVSVNGGWRIDWKSPAGGYQATIILN
jgi:hypothetical protein